MSLIGTYRFIAHHPLTRDHKLPALRRWLAWQVSSRLSGHPAVVPFVDETRLQVAAGMKGATGNIYCGLHEFEDMAFVLHFMRPGALFVDIGANVGAYSILAAATGAAVISFEPVPSTFEHLLDNIHLNRFAARIDARNQAVGREAGVLRMTADRDTTNQVIAEDADYAGTSVSVPQVALDDALQGLPTPRMIKIDVEGFEADVLAGSRATLAKSELQAVVMELNGSGAQYGHHDQALRDAMASHGFMPCVYAPHSRQLRPAPARSTAGNTLFVRSVEAAQATVAAARPFLVLGQRL